NATRIVVDVGGDESWTDDGEEQHQPCPPTFECPEQRHGGYRWRSMEMTSSAVMIPDSRPCSSTTASVTRLYLSKIAATSSSGVSGAQLTGGSLSSRSGVDSGEMAILTSGTAPTSLYEMP